MRVNILKTFALFLFLSLTGAAFGQPYLLISMTNQVWKYNQSGANLGSLWRSATYDDTVAGWQSGNGVFAFETDNQLVLQQDNTTLSLTNTTGGRITTYYFRTHFNLTSDPYRVIVMVTNLVDDGAVFYVNGIEVNRLNMPAAPAPITYITTATTAGEAVYTFFTIPYDTLVQGDNVIEVEVHNGSSTSSDIAFGLSAMVVNPVVTSTLVITNQPKDITSSEGAPVSFSAGVSGFPITYVQWFWNNTAIPGANRLTYTIPDVNLTNAGTYTLTISNSTGAVLSSPAVLTILADTNGPVILAADGTDSPTNVVVTFNERVLPITATNTANYIITNIGAGTTFVPSKATLAPNGSNVTLVTTTSRLPNTNYLVIVNNVRDASPRTNLIALNSAYPISSSINLIDELSGYYVYNPVPDFGDDAAPASIWKQPGFNPFTQDTTHAWGHNLDFDSAKGIFWFGGDDLPGPQGIKLGQTDGLVVYFSQPMFYNASPLGLTLMLQYLVDDGAVFYMNGTEFLRVRLPATGAITTNTVANRAGYPPSWEGPVAFNQTQLIFGTNNFAVELHMATSIDTNFDFAARLSADISSYAVGPVVITRQPTNTTVLEGQSATFSFYGAGPSKFQWYQNGSPIAGATNSTYTIASATLAMNSNRFSVIAMNSTSSATSSNAFLTVLSDTNAPSLVSAYVVSANQILVTFSEPMFTTPAQLTSNYLITNRTAANLNILSATVTNGSNVLLTVSGGSAGQYVLVAKTNLQDASSLHNALNSRTNTATVGLKVNIPIDTDWKYNNLGQDLGTAWHGKAYADNTWSNGLALIYHEDAGMPAPKNTELPLNSPGGGFVTTFYFRKHLLLAAGATNATITINHVIDDGLIAYINDTEFHRFNMAAGTPTAATFANVSVGDAVFAGPFNSTTTNIGAGDNVLAAEVHQINATSSDFVFGAQIDINAPSTILVPPPPGFLVPASKATNTFFSLKWTNYPPVVYRLQGTTNLANPSSSTVWTNVTTGITTLNNVSTFTTNTKTNRAFYRLITP